MGYCARYVRRAPAYSRLTEASVLSSARCYGLEHSLSLDVFTIISDLYVTFIYKIIALN